jgi:hypothetical protein
MRQRKKELAACEGPAYTTPCHAAVAAAAEAERVSDAKAIRWW